MIVVLHHNDLDGYGAAAVVAYVNRNDTMEIEYIPCDYSDSIASVDTIKKRIGDRKDIDGVYILDLSFTQKTAHNLLEIIEEYGGAVWIDHHKSSVDYLAAKIDPEDLIRRTLGDYETEKLHIFVNAERSGAYLAWCYFFGVRQNDKSIPEVIQLIDDYDRWQFKFGDNAKYLNLVFYSSDALKNPSSFQWIDLIDGEDLIISSYLSAGIHISRYLDHHYKSYREANAYESELAGNKCICLNYRANSTIFGDLYDQYPLCVSWIYTGKEYKYSIYSNPNFSPQVNCAEIAQSFGGGGHIGAAGFTTKERVV